MDNYLCTCCSHAYNVLPLPCCAPSSPACVLPTQQYKLLVTPFFPTTLALSPPQYRAWREAAALSQLGNPAWDALFGRVMPQAAGHIKSLLGVPPSAACSVQFGSNSHELVARLLSTFLDRRRSESTSGTIGSSSGCGSGDSGAVGGGVAAAAAVGGSEAGSRGSGEALMRVLTSDTEFYSITRQLNRFAEVGLAEVEAVPADPPATFSERCCAAVAAAAAQGRPFDVVYLSQTTYLTQQTLIPDIPATVHALREAAWCGPGAAAGAAAADGMDGAAGTARAAGTAGRPNEPLRIIIDGYHGFCALPTSLGASVESFCYVGGLLKHAGCGANCAFLLLPSRLAARPVLTGWLADPSVLGPDSNGIQLGSEVGYCADLALQGGTPAFMQPLLTFNHLMQLWREARPVVSVDLLHSHVMGLHARFLEGLPSTGHTEVNTKSLLGPQDPAIRSHTLTFRLADASAAKAAVESLAAHGILVDTRKAHVRLGFGPNHSVADVDALLAALRQVAAAKILDAGH